MNRLNLNAVLVFLAAASFACRGGGDAEGSPRAGPAAKAQPRAEQGAPKPVDARRENADAHGAEHADEHGHAGQGKVSDLDRPVDELFADGCEHGKKTHECDECRYGVGVVRVPSKVLEGGLLRKATVSKRRAEAPVTLTGEIRFDERRVTHISPRIEGTVRKVHASLGERVRRGQTVVELESVHVGEAESEYLAAQAALRLASSGFERQERLRKEQISSEREYLSARQEHEAAQIRARAAEQKLARLGVGAADVERLASTRRTSGDGALLVRAPADGIVLEMHAVPGELVKPEASIVTVGDVSSVWVWADLHEDQLGRMLDAQRTGKLRAEVVVRAFPEVVFPGTVDFVGPTMDERTRTVKARVVVANSGGKLRAGMFASVRVFLPGTEEAVAVPKGAVLADAGRSFVFVHHHGDYWVRRPIETGRRWLEWVEVKAGLTGNELLAADGAFLLKSDVLRSKMGAGCAD